MKVNGEVVATGQVPISAPLLFTGNDCLDIGIALGSPVSLEYFDKMPFKFNGTIERVHVEYMPIAKARVGDMTTKEKVAA
jgi:arylsulfatase